MLDLLVEYFRYAVLYLSLRLSQLFIGPALDSISIAKLSFSEHRVNSVFKVTQFTNFIYYVPPLIVFISMWIEVYSLFLIFRIPVTQHNFSNISDAKLSLSAYCVLLDKASLLA